MTISLETVSKSLACDGVSKAFLLTQLVFLTRTDLRVFLIGPDGTGAEWTLGDQYNLTGDGTAGSASLTTTAADPYANTYNIFVLRNTDDIQNEQLNEGDGFPAKNIETAFDRRVLRSQEIQFLLDRCLSIGSFEGPPTKLPVAASRALRALVFDEAGNPGVSTQTFEAYMTNLQTIVSDGISALRAIATAAAASAAAAGHSSAHATDEATISANAATVSANLVNGLVALLQSILSSGVLRTVVMPSKTVTEDTYICALADHGWTLHVDARGGPKNIVVSNGFGNAAGEYWVKIQRHKDDDSSNPILGFDDAEIPNLIGQISAPKNGRNFPSFTARADGVIAYSDALPE